MAAFPGRTRGVLAHVTPAATLCGFQRWDQCWSSGPVSPSYPVPPWPRLQAMTQHPPQPSGHCPVHVQTPVVGMAVLSPSLASPWQSFTPRSGQCETSPRWLSGAHPTSLWSPCHPIPFLELRQVPIHAGPSLHTQVSSSICLPRPSCQQPDGVATAVLTSPALTQGLDIEATGTGGSHAAAFAGSLSPVLRSGNTARFP